MLVGTITAIADAYLHPLPPPGDVDEFDTEKPKDTTLEHQP